ncbi:MAG: MarR family transcriptional regulator [Flavobacteriales bacterium]|nr:MarR family transcriptional regulator [Flavobacteriales bacterium]|tara:strand:- start:5501 stop:5932 length:432 start_codon:yes stop_codon:yes gene_type:complete
MEPEDTIDYNIRKTWYNIAKIYNKTASEYMSSMSMGMVLLNIDVVEGTQSTLLGPIMGMESTSLSRTLNKLEELGVIERVRDDMDKRKTIIKLTELGQKRRVVAKNAVLEFNNTIFENLSQNDIDNFFSSIRKINKIINKELI